MCPLAAKEQRETLSRELEDKLIGEGEPKPSATVDVSMASSDVTLVHPRIDLAQSTQHT